jgi:hypothetical protein
MEALKVKKKDVLVFNLILFLCLSYIFLYLQYAYRHHLSPFSTAYLRKSFELFWYAIIPMIGCGLLVWKHHRWSVPFYSFCTVLVGYKVIEGLFIEFNKIIVIALFFYAVISYFLYQLYGHYLALASLNANYSSSDLFDPLLKEISCSLIVQDKSFQGFLTNWDEEGCFIKLSEPLALGDKVKVVIDFKGRSFEQDGELVAHSIDLTGIGIKFGLSPKELNVFNWSEFNELIEELGFKPERLR